MAPSLLVIGSANTDLVIRTPRFPAPGETLLGGEFFMFPGGKGANQAVAAARLGARVTFVCKLGHDVFGHNALAGYAQDGIDTTYVRRTAAVASGTALIMVDEQGQNSIVVASGANAYLTPADLDGMEPALATAALVVVQLEVPLPTVVQAVRLAHARGKRVVLNPAPAQPLPPDLYPQLYLLTPNETEAETLTGQRVRTVAEARAAALTLRGYGAQNVIITLGAAGAYLLTDSFTGLVPAAAVPVVDTTAAGDVFTGALAAALARGHGWEAAARFANRAAGLAVTRLGAQSSIPYFAEVSSMDEWMNG